MLVIFFVTYVPNSFSLRDFLAGSLLQEKGSAFKLASLRHEITLIPLSSRSEPEVSKGSKKDEALRLAKLDFLEKNQDNPLSHPYYWAGIVISGNNAPLSKSLHPLIWVFSGIVVIGFGFFWFRRRNSS